jgi:drug/metabolite transporter (DMT)-like permease
MAKLAPYRIPILIAIFCTLWSSAFSAAKIALTGSPPLLFLTARFVLAGTVMLLAAVIAGQNRPAWRDIAALALLGVINNALFLSLSFSGMGTISAGLAALITSANPILTALAAAMFLRERLTLRKMAGLALGVCGVAFIVRERISGGAESWKGVGLICGAVIALVTGTILFKLLAPRGGLWSGSGIQNLAGGLAVAPFAFAFESVGDIAPSWTLLAALLYLALGVSIIGLLVWFYLLTTGGAMAASSYHFLNPPLGVFFGWLLLGEHLSLPDLLGIVPVAAGIYLVTRPAKRRRAALKIATEEGAASAGRVA